MTGEILWQPDAPIRRAHLTRFMDRVAARHGMPVPDYASLHRWSVESPDAFWGELATFCDLRWRRSPGGRAGARRAAIPAPAGFPAARSTSPRTCCASGTITRR